MIENNDVSLMIDRKVYVYHHLHCDLETVLVVIRLPSLDVDTGRISNALEKRNSDTSTEARSPFISIDNLGLEELFKRKFRDFCRD